MCRLSVELIVQLSVGLVVQIVCRTDGKWTRIPETYLYMIEEAGGSLDSGSMETGSLAVP